MLDLILGHLQLHYQSEPSIAGGLHSELYCHILEGSLHAEKHMQTFSLFTISQSKMRKFDPGFIGMIRKAHDLKLGHIFFDDVFSLP